MSAEFTSEYNENILVTAIENMERTMRSFNYVGEYILEIQEAYADSPDGEIELRRMVRAAQFISHRSAADFKDEVQSIYHGELLGLELINNLDPGVGQPYKMGYAQSFIKHQLDKDRPKNTQHPAKSAETSLQHEVRMAKLSRSMQKNLSEPLYNHGINPIYEEFGRGATSKLSHDPLHQELSMIGFRMIVTEALNPSSAKQGKTVQSILKAFADKEEALAAEMDTAQTVANLESLFATSIDEVKEIVDDPGDLEWEDVSHIRKTLLNKYIELEMPPQEGSLQAQSLDAINYFIEEQLSAFNRTNKFISTNDLLNIKGELFAITHQENAVAYPMLYNNHIQIRGIFEGIHVVEVPANKDLLEATNRPEEYEKRQPHLVQSLAIRIKDPVFIFELSEDEGHVENGAGETIDIPLNYENVSYSRIQAEKLEAEA